MLEYLHENFCFRTFRKACYWFVDSNPISEAENSPKMNVKGQAPAIAQENQQMGGEALTHTRSHTHFSITECSTK